MSDTLNSYKIAVEKHPLPWKCRQRRAGERDRGMFPWEVIDDMAGRVALCTDSFSASVICRAVDEWSKWQP